MPRSPKLSAGLALAVFLPVFGFLAGALIGGRLLAPGPGWDALDSMLGGMMVGTAAGLGLALLLIRRLTPASLARAAWIALGGLALLVGVLVLSRVR